LLQIIKDKNNGEIDTKHDNISMSTIEEWKLLGTYKSIGGEVHEQMTSWLLIYRYFYSLGEILFRKFLFL
jgi:hypothetical protein